MNIGEILILAFALSLDAMIVSFSYGLIIKNQRLKNALILSAAFGFFQFIMPVTGWHFTSAVYNYMKMYSKWIVFAVFSGLAIKFLKEAFTKKSQREIHGFRVLQSKLLSRYPKQQNSGEAGAECGTGLNEEQKTECISAACTIGLAIATSIDAFGAGISLRFLNVSSIFPSMITGMVTFCLSLTGFYTAAIFNNFLSKTVEIISAVLLIYLAVKSIV